MDATASRRVFGGRGRWWPTTGLLAALVLAGVLVQGCSDNNGRVTQNTVPVIGVANTSANITVQVGVNPNSITPGRRAGVTAFVTNTNGFPLAGKSVQFSTTVGTLDQTVVTTNAAGQASTTLSITATDAQNAGGTSATVTANVEGAVGTGSVNFGTPTPPTPPTVLALNPSSIQLTEGASGPAPNMCRAGPFAAGGTLSAQFTVSGGVPPYRFSAAGAVPGATVSKGTYTAPSLGPRAGGFTTTDTVTVVDSTGTAVNGTVVITCTATQ
jgi:hypothetical protein